jgi:hypothetical protein
LRKSQHVVLKAELCSINDDLSLHSTQSCVILYESISPVIYETISQRIPGRNRPRTVDTEDGVCGFPDDTVPTLITLSEHYCSQTLMR